MLILAPALLGRPLVGGFRHSYLLVRTWLEGVFTWAANLPQIAVWRQAVEDWLKSSVSRRFLVVAETYTVSVKLVEDEKRSRRLKLQRVLLEWRTVPVSHEEIDESRNPLSLVRGDITAVVRHPSRFGDIGIVTHVLD